MILWNIITDWIDRKVRSFRWQLFKDTSNSDTGKMQLFIYAKVDERAMEPTNLVINLTNKEKLLEEGQVTGRYLVMSPRNREVSDLWARVQKI